MESSVSAADFYRRQASQQPPSNDWYLICIAIAYTSCHGADDDAGKKSFHCMMRYLLTVELVLTLLASVDVTLLMLVVRIMVLICAFFNAEFIPKSTKKLWVMACEQAPVVWQWLRNNAPVVWQGLREQWSDVRRYLAQQSVSTERGRPGNRGQGRRMFSPEGRTVSQDLQEVVMRAINPEPVMQEIRPEPSAEQEGNSQQLVVGRATGLPVPRVVTPEIVFQMPFDRWLAPTAPSPDAWMTDYNNQVAADAGHMQMVVHPEHSPNKRKRDEALTADFESERACKEART